MNSTEGIVLVVFVLAIVLLALSRRFLRVEGKLSAPLVKGEFRGSNPENQAASGTAEVSNVSGRNVSIGDTIGAEGDNVVKGEARATNIDAQEDIQLGDVIGVKKKQAGE